MLFCLGFVMGAWGWYAGIERRGSVYDWGYCKKGLTSLTTVLWSLRSGLGTHCRAFGGRLGGRRGGLAVR
jgi:hypothetical protein